MATGAMIEFEEMGMESLRPELLAAALRMRIFGWKKLPLLPPWVECLPRSPDTLILTGCYCGTWDDYGCGAATKSD